MATTLTICDTCKRESWEAGSEQTDGEVLAGFIEAQVEAYPDVALRRHSCLMGCAQACNVVIQGPGKISYTLGKFDPSEDAAEAILAYAQAHAESETGQVPFRTWPQGVKGHFITRHPPLSEV